MVGDATQSMTVAETANYLQKQKVKGWPGSKSIHPAESVKRRQMRLKKERKKV